MEFRIDGQAEPYLVVKFPRRTNRIYPKMANKPHEWTFGYLDLAKLTGMGTNAIMQQVSRGNLDPGDLESVVIWLARHAKPATRKRIVAHALYMDSDLKKSRAPKA